MTTARSRCGLCNGLREYEIEGAIVDCGCNQRFSFGQPIDVLAELDFAAVHFWANGRRDRAKDLATAATALADFIVAVRNESENAFDERTRLNLIAALRKIGAQP